MVEFVKKVHDDQSASLIHRALAKILRQGILTDSSDPNPSPPSADGAQHLRDPQELRKRRFSFVDTNIPVGAILRSVVDPDKTASILDVFTMAFEGEATNLSSAALKLRHARGYMWKIVQGPGN